MFYVSAEEIQSWQYRQSSHSLTINLHLYYNTSINCLIYSDRSVKYIHLTFYTMASEY